MEKKLIIKPATSENMWAASVKMASELEIIPPANSRPIKMKQMKETKNNFFMALLASLIFRWNLLSCSKAHLWTYPFFYFPSKEGFLERS